MPIPLIIWGIGLGVAAIFNKEITQGVNDILNSDTAKDLRNEFNKATEAELAPLKKIIEDSYHQSSSNRRKKFVKFKKESSEYQWKLLLNLGLTISARDASYAPVFADLSYVDINC